MKLEVNIEKKHAFLIIGSLFILAIIGLINSQGPEIFGHSIEEIGLPNCENGQVLSFNQTWICADQTNIGSTNCRFVDSSSGRKIIDVAQECIDKVCKLILVQKHGDRVVTNSVDYYQRDSDGAWSAANIFGMNGVNDGPQEEHTDSIFSVDPGFSPSDTGELQDDRNTNPSESDKDKWVLEKASLWVCPRIEETV